MNPEILNNHLLAARSSAAAAEHYLARMTEDSQRRRAMLAMLERYRELTGKYETLVAAAERAPCSD